jgi:hypothetical protein
MGLFPKKGFSALLCSLLCSLLESFYPAAVSSDWQFWHTPTRRTRALQRPKSHFSFRLGIFRRGGGLFNLMMFNLQSEFNMPQKPPLPMS